MSGLRISKARVHISTAVGVFQLFLGLGVALPCGIQAISGFTGHSASVWQMLLFLTGLALGALLASQGTKRLALLSRFRRVCAVMSRTACETLENLAQRTRIPQPELVRDLRAMQKARYFQNTHLDTGRGLFLLVGPHFVPRPAPENAAWQDEYMEVHHPSVAPIYSVGAVWVVYVLLFPMYRWYDFLLAGALSVLAYGTVRRWAPDRIVYEKRPLPPPPEPVTIDTGNPELDEALTAASRTMTEMVHLNQRLTNPRMNTQVQEILRLSGQIFDFVKLHPENLRTIRQFMSYYLPTTLKLLNNYAEFTRQPEKGEHIVDSMEKIEEMMETIVEACKRQLDDLYRDKAMDVSVDIEVMQSILREQGLVQEENRVEGGA